MSELEFIEVLGSEARMYCGELAQLRLTVFNEFPYLYDGTLDYEKKYLETYFKSDKSLIILVKDKGQIIGASTCIAASDEEENFQRPFTDNKMPPAEVCYFGESILLKQYRGQGIGKIFFERRELFAKNSLNSKILAFCAVIRSQNHLRRPTSYVPLDNFWNSLGFKKADGMVTKYEWKDIGEENSTTKLMQFWIKKI